LNKFESHITKELQIAFKLLSYIE